ncbi:transglutaminase-like domain-containing protein [Antarcticirhabdus aurantiaca]|uniref:Transglutaminase family protein n=1 Tax=Antarcticirhabdus aurantiaca TaxID=2606717 RepID=A0ACD4NN07_9HYPH|nr:transglutaminase family protein [Antarcticirhabdus aurantiaca]WAJ28248.1 transglutaminase family protein [Jeongeuplla avenae]
MRIRIGSELTFEFPQPTPVIALLAVHFSRASDLETPDLLMVSPSVPVEGYRDGYGNWCSRFLAPAGLVSLRTQAIIRDAGRWDSEEADMFAGQTMVHELPAETLQFLLGSRYCETDLLSETAWKLFGHQPLGWARVQAIVDFVHAHLTFGYEHSRPTRTAWEAFNERRGVCRDFAHLALAFCRCLNIPARYCTGYVSDIGLPPPYAPQDFAAWIEVFLAGRWHMFDPRNNSPRVGRVLVARGRDAADVPLTLTFGPGELKRFVVTTEEVAGAATQAGASFA